METAVHLASARRAPRTFVRFGREHLKTVAQIGTVCVAGIGLAQAFAAYGIKIPASAAGMALLFAAIALRFVRAEWLEPGAPFLARHLGLFFVPILVGVGLAWPFPARVLLPVFATLAVSATIGLVVTGIVFQVGMRRRTL